MWVQSYGAYYSMETHGHHCELLVHYGLCKVARHAPACCILNGLGTASPGSSAVSAAAAHLLLVDLVCRDGLVQLLAAGRQLVQPPVHVCWLKVRQARLVEHLHAVLKDAQALQQLVAIHVELLQLAHLGPGQWNAVYGRVHGCMMLLEDGMWHGTIVALAMWVLRAGHGGWCRWRG